MLYKYLICAHVILYAAAKSLQSCPTLCDPIDGSPPGSAIPGILQARTLEWVAVSFSNAWKWKVKVKSLSHVWLFTTPWTAASQAPPSMGFSRQECWSGVPSPSPVILYESHDFIFKKLYSNRSGGKEERKKMETLLAGKDTWPWLRTGVTQLWLYQEKRLMEGREEVIRKTVHLISLTGDSKVALLQERVCCKQRPKSK